MFDPSRMNPKTITELTDLMRGLTPEQMMKMQSLMHNQMAGFNVAQEMMDFEKSLPPGFREKMARIMYMANGIEVPDQAPPSASIAPPTSPLAAPVNEAQARLVILQSVAQGLITPEAALPVLFPE